MGTFLEKLFKTSPITQELQYFHHARSGMIQRTNSILTLKLAKFSETLKLLWPKIF